MKEETRLRISEEIVSARKGFGHIADNDTDCLALRVLQLTRMADERNQARNQALALAQENVRLRARLSKA